MKFIPWPYIKIDEEWSIPIEIMLAVWNQMVKLDRVKSTFYDGSIKDAENFVYYMQNPLVSSMLVVEAEKVRLRAVAWLSNMVNGSAYSHFCYLDKYDQTVAELVLNQWKKIPSLSVVVGITPVSYKLVLRMIAKWGFKQIGEIPQICDMRYENRREAGAISYYLIKEEEDGR